MLIFLLQLYAIIIECKFQNSYIAERFFEKSARIRKVRQK